MCAADIRQAIGSSAKDDALARHFLIVWPVIESILRAFAKANGLPIFAYLNGHQVFRSSADAMPGKTSSGVPTEKTWTIGAEVVGCCRSRRPDVRTEAVRSRGSGSAA